MTDDGGKNDVIDVGQFALARALTQLVTYSLVINKGMKRDVNMNDFVR